MTGLITRSTMTMFGMSAPMVHVRFSWVVRPFDTMFRAVSLEGRGKWLRYNFKNVMMWQRDLMLEALKMLMQLETYSNPENF